MNLRDQFGSSRLRHGIYNKPFGEQKKDSIRSFWGWHDALWIVEFDDTKMLSSECNVLWTIWHFGIRQQHPRYFSHRSSRSRYTDPNLPGRCLTTPSQGCLRIADPVNQDTLVPASPTKNGEIMVWVTHWFAWNVPVCRSAISQWWQNMWIKHQDVTGSYKLALKLSHKETAKALWEGNCSGILRILNRGISSN